MPRHANYVPHGVIPAVLLPFDNDLVDRRGGFRKHLRDVAAVEGLSASPSTRIRPKSPPAPSRSSAACSISRRTRSAPGCRSSTASGPTAASKPRGSPAWRQQGGASALLVFPPAPFTLGQIAADGARAFQAHRRCDRSAADRVPVSAGDRPGLSEGHAAEDVRGGAHASAPSRTGSATCRTTSGTSARCKILSRPVNVLTTHSSWLFASLVMGCNGLLSGSGSVIADLQAQTVPRRAEKRPRRGQTTQRAHRADGARVLRRSLRRHAQPHEGGAGAARQAAARGGAAAAGQARSRRDRAHPPGSDRSRIAG